MAKHTQTTTSYTCDFCGKNCEPVRQLRLLHSFNAYGEFRNEVHINVSAYIPYGTADGDVCADCLDKVLTDYMKERFRNKGGKVKNGHSY